MGSVTPITYTQTVAGYVNGDTSAVLTGGPVFGSSLADNTSPAGTYTITASAAGLGTTNNNYTFTTINGTLTINAPAGGGGGPVPTPPPPVPTPTPTPTPTPVPTPKPPVVKIEVPDSVRKVSADPELNYANNNSFGAAAVDVIKQTNDIFKQFGAQNDNGRFVFDNYAPISDVLFLTPANMGLMDTSIHGSASPSTAAPANENTSNHSNDNNKEKAANDNKQGNTKSQATQRQQLLTVDPFLAQEFEIDQRRFQF